MRAWRKWFARVAVWGWLPSAALLYGGMANVAIGGSAYNLLFCLPMVAVIVGVTDGDAIRRAYREYRIIMNRIIQEKDEN